MSGSLSGSSSIKKGISVRFTRPRTSGAFLLAGLNASAVTNPLGKYFFRRH